MPPKLLVKEVGNCQVFMVALSRLVLFPGPYSVFQYGKAGRGWEQGYVII